MNIKVQCWNLRRKCLNKLRHRKEIALTFDDGYKYADQILEKLEQYGVKSTFFVCGTCIKKNCDIYKKIYYDLGVKRYVLYGRKLFFEN